MTVAGKTPSTTQMYAMIKVLRKRGHAGDVNRVIELNKLIEQEKDKKALEDLEKYFPTPKK